jgi:riboflavin kinase/FMN adenylyltransferase
VADGNITEAGELLGRPFSLCGAVEHGDGRGGPELGFPTANLQVDPAQVQPAPGIYAGMVTRASGETFVSAISVGRRPTFYEAAEPLIECYLLDFAGDLYGEVIEVTFVEKLRDELRFDSVEDLIEQMHRDVAETRLVIESRS